MIPTTLLNTLKGLFVTLAAASFPSVFLFAHNAHEAVLSDLWHPLGGSIFLAIVLWMVFRGLSGATGPACLLTQVAFLSLAYYRPIESCIRSLHWSIRYWHIVPTLAVAFFLTALAVRRASETKRNAWTKLSQVVGLVAAGLLVFNLGRATLLVSRDSTASSRQETGMPDALHAESTKDLPDFYFIILDEYSAFHVIRRYYDYDNSDFLVFLEQNRFNVSQTSRNLTYETSIEMSNILDMSPTVDGNTPYSERIARYKEGRLLKFFKSLGYRVAVLNTVWPSYLTGDETFTRTESSPSASVDGHGRTLRSIALDLSVLYPFIRKATASEHRYIERAFDWLGDLESGEEPLFVFAHMRCPHEPFLFFENGSRIPAQHQHNWQDKRYYLGQFIYTTRRIQEIITRILEHNPSAVILLQSDHSARAYDFDSGEPVLDIAFEQKTAILNAVYLGGRPLDIEGLSGLDTSVLVYKTLFGPLTTPTEGHHEE